MVLCRWAQRRVVFSGLISHNNLLESMYYQYSLHGGGWSCALLTPSTSPSANKRDCLLAVLLR